MNEAASLVQAKMDPQHYAALVSFDTHVKELVAVQAELAELHDQNEAVSQEIKENKTQLTTAFMNALNSNRMYEMNGNQVAVVDDAKYTAQQLAELKNRGQVFSLNTDKLPEPKQQAIKQADTKTEETFQQTNAYAMQPQFDKEDNADFERVETGGDFFRQSIGRQDAKIIRQSIQIRVITIREESGFNFADTISAERMTNLLFNLMLGHDMNALVMHAMQLQERQTNLRGNIIRTTTMEQNLFSAIRADSRRLAPFNHGTEAMMEALLNGGSPQNVRSFGFGR
jgi:hypothetical protein